MASLPKVLNGARAQVMVGNKIVGTINSITWNVGFDTQDAYVLGKTAAAAIEYTAAEPCTGSLNGWACVDHSAFADLGLPRVQDLLTAPYTQLAIFDRVTNKRIGRIQSVRLLGESGGYSARQMSERSVPYKGIFYSNETVTNSEAPGATDLP
jgi:hypothetical protein